MELDEFWALIQVLDAGRQDVDFERLTDRLAGRNPEEITGFEDRLAVLLHALDTHEHAKAARARGDWFLYVRCAAVAAGRDAYAEVLADPSRLRQFARREAELLLPVAGKAYERRTGMLWEHQAPVSYESGSNAAGWGEPGRPEPEWPSQGTESMPWLMLNASVFLPEGWPAAYPLVVEHIREAVTADPAWQAWWAGAGIAECHLSLLLTSEVQLGQPGTTVKVGRARVQVDSIQRPAPFAGHAPQQVLPRAVQDVTGLFEALRGRLGLAALPPVHLPDLPPDLPDGMERPATLRQTLAEGGGGLLKGLFGRFTRRVPH